jgi:cold shock CspA family protein
MADVIKRLVRDRGFGFIKTPDGSEYFFHKSDLTNARFEDLQEGQDVKSFAIEQSPKGPRARDVEV